MFYSLKTAYNHNLLPNKNLAIITFTNFYKKKSTLIVNIISRSFKTSTQKEVVGFCDKWMCLEKIFINFRKVSYDVMG